MPKVKLTESELRKIILMSLHEAGDPAAPAAVDDDDGAISFPGPFKPTQTMLKEVRYLIDAQQALGRPYSKDATPPLPPKNTLSLRAMSTAVSASPATGNLSLDWDRSVAGSMAIYKAWLKLQIINTINDSTKLGRKFFHVGDTVYTTQGLLASEGVIAYNRLANAKKVDVTTPAFFIMLDNEDFVNKISKGVSAAGTTQYFADKSAIAFIDEEALAPIIAVATSAANSAVAAMKEVWEQFNTDFVEEFFCLPVLLPNGVWKRASNTGDPRSTPWRMSYGVYNIASQAVGVPGGIAALYRKLYTYSNEGPSVQFAASPQTADPFLTAGLFRESIEVRKTLMTVTELRRVIQAAFDVKLRGQGYRDAVLEEGILRDLGDLGAGVVAMGKGAWQMTKRTLGVGEELSPLEKLAAKSTASALNLGPINSAKIPLVDFFKKLSYKTENATKAVDSVVGSPAVLPPISEMGFQTVLDTSNQTELYNIIKKMLDEMSSGKSLDKVIGELTNSGVFSAGDLANLGREKRAAFLRMIRTARANGKFLTGDNRTKTAFLNSFVKKTQKGYLDAFSVTDVIPGSQNYRTLTYDFAQQSFIFNGFDKASGKVVSNVPIDAEDAKKIFGTDVDIDRAEDVAKGVMTSETGQKVEILDEFKKFQELNLASVEDALIGMLANPTRAYITARLGDGALDATKFEVGLDAIPGEASSLGRTTEAIEGLFGQYTLNSKGSNIFKVLNFVERVVIAGPVVGAARGVRNLLGGKGLLADVADIIATNRLYAYLLGYIIFHATRAALPDIKSTASDEDSVFGQTMATLSSGFSTSPLVPGIVNLLIDVFGKAFDFAVGGSDENIQALFNPDVMLSAGDNLATALLAFGKILDVKPDNFPDLLTDAADAGSRLGQIAEMATEGITAGTQALTSEQSAATTTQVNKLQAAAAAVAELAAERGVSSSGNPSWAKLEQSRTAAENLTVDGVKTTTAGLGGGTAPSISSHVNVMTFNYGTIKAGNDKWLQIGNLLMRLVIGRNLPPSMEALAWLKIKTGSSIAPSAGLKFSSYLAAQGGVIKADSVTIGIVNAEYEKLADALGEKQPGPTTSTAPAP